MTDFILRTENFQPDEITNFFVETPEDRIIIDKLKSSTPIILEGSRGTGKTFLLRIAENEMFQNISENNVFPIYLPFSENPLIFGDKFKFWMLAKISLFLTRSFKKAGYLAENSKFHSDSFTDERLIKLEILREKYEKSWKNAENELYDNTEIPDIDEIRFFVEDICTAFSIQRICFLFDEVAHVFRPDQQRQFFSLFRSLRSRFISCNAAVYPGITSFGDIFDQNHDAEFLKIERSISEKTYLSSMRKIVLKQASQKMLIQIEQNGNNFSAIAYSVSGNPRQMMRLLQECKSMSTKDVNNAIKSFFREKIWTEHTNLGEKFNGHKRLIDWGREFLEDDAIPKVNQINSSVESKSRNETTNYIWVDRDSPHYVKESLRMLVYTGIMSKFDEKIRVLGSSIGIRYSINIGCIGAVSEDPIKEISRIISILTTRRFVQYGSNSLSFQKLSDSTILVDEDISHAIKTQMSSSIDNLEITKWQKDSLHKIGITSVSDLFEFNESDLIEKVRLIGEKRARKIFNAARAAISEYLSG